MPQVPYLPGPQPIAVTDSTITPTNTGHVTQAWLGWFNWFANLVRGDTNGARIWWNTGSPEGVVTATVGSLFLRTDGGAITTLYVKTSGTGNTGWTAK